MNGGEASAAIGPAQKTAALAREDNRPTHERAGRERAKSDDESRLDQHQFLVEPPMAFFHFVPVRTFVKAPFAALLMLEMFYGVSHIDRTAVEPCLFQSQIEDTAGRPNERTTLPVFLIARLFADQQQRRVYRAFTENGLRCIPIQRAALAMRRIVNELDKLWLCEGLRGRQLTPRCRV